MNSYRKKLLITVITIGFTTLLVAGSFVLGSNLNDLMFANESKYFINLNKDNRPDISSSTIGSFKTKTQDNNLITFEYEMADSYPNGFLQLASGGCLSNPYDSSKYHNAINSIEYIKVNYNYATNLDIYYGFEGNYVSKDGIKSNQKYYFDNERPAYFKIENQGQGIVDILEIEIKYTCTPSEYVDLKGDVFYPSVTHKPYKMTVPTLKSRLTYNKDKSIATLFAPHVSKNSGFYDVAKNFVNDSHLCWAAANSNLLAWYLNELELNNVNLHGFSKDVNDIFDLFRANWDDLEGYDFMQGLAWFFTGQILSGAIPPELKNPNSGGYLKFLPNVGEVWSILDPVNDYSVIGNYEKQYPFIENNNEIDYSKTYEHFSKSIIKQMHYGPSAITISQASTSTLGSHAITLWGVDFDTNSGLITKIYITDSDDVYTKVNPTLVPLKISRGDGSHSVTMEDYYLPTGVQSPFKHVTSAMNLFSPDVLEIA